MASDSESVQTQIRSVLERLVNSSNRQSSLFLPILFGLNGSDPDQNSTDGSDPQSQGESFVLINPFTQRMVVIEGANLSSLIGPNPDKVGRPPASKASIEALANVEIGENEVGECAICLEEWGFGGNEFVKEMPCKHRFHGSCLEKWLKIHGSCPVCRFELPFDNQDDREKKSGGERAILVEVAFDGMNFGRSSSSSGDADQRASDSSVVFRSCNMLSNLNHCGANLHILLIHKGFLLLAGNP